MSAVLAHLICVALVAVDQLSKTVRMQWLARGLGRRARFIDMLTVNVTGDAASALTPMRVGGEPTRVAGIMKAGLSVSDTIALVTVEGTVEYVTVIAITALMGWRYGGEWWRATRGTLVPALRHALPWAAAIVLVGAGIWLVLRRFVPTITIHVGGTLRDSLRNASRMPAWAIGITVPLTIIHILARVAVLPVLVSTIASPPPMGAVWLGSLALLYGQLLVPTPSGAGAVELSFLNGAAGDIGPDATEMLILWRFYTTLTGIFLGFAFGVPLYGAAARRWLLRRRLARRVLRGDSPP